MVHSFGDKNADKKIWVIFISLNILQDSGSEIEKAAFCNRLTFSLMGLSICVNLNDPDKS